MAEVGAAVEWGSPQLKASADVIVSGDGPAAVAEFVYGLAATGRLPVPIRPRRRLLLGHTEDGREFSLKVRGRNILVAGDAKSGKSWVAGLLSEQLILQGYSVCVIDPEGDYRSLEALPGVTVLGGDDPPPTPRELLRALRYPDRSFVIDLSKVPHDEKVEYIESVLPAVNTIRRRTGLPHRIVIDEAHYFLHGEPGKDLLDWEDNGYTVVTYRASQLSPTLMAHTDVLIVTCESDPLEIASLRQRCGTCQSVSASSWSLLSRLKIGQAVALPVTEEAGGELRLFSIGPRLTPHVRHRQKYVDVPVPDQRAFVFVSNAKTTGLRIRTLRQFVEALDKADLAHADPYIRRADFSRWIGDVFGDHSLAAEIKTCERRYLRESRREVLPEMAGAIRSRYDLAEEGDAEASRAVEQDVP